MSGSRRPQNTTDRPGYLIKLAQAALHAQMARALHEYGVTLTQFAVLTALAEEPGLSNAELARRAFITPQSMNENLRELEQRGWVIRSRHPTHGRIRQTELTGEGRTTLQNCDATVTAIEQRMLAELDPDQRRQLATALTYLYRRLEPREPDALRRGDLPQHSRRSALDPEIERATGTATPSREQRSPRRSRGPKPPRSDQRRGRLPTPPEAADAEQAQRESGGRLIATVASGDYPSGAAR